MQATSEPSREPVSLPSMLDEYPQSLPLQCGDTPENRASKNKDSESREKYQILLPTENK